MRALVMCLALLMALRCHGQVITLDRPGERAFILDRADLLTDTDEERVRSIADRLLTDTGTPIIVVTIESMSHYNQRSINSIESFAKILFDQWGIGHLTIDGQPSNTGILLLVSRDDRKARIELGIGWEYDKEAAAQQIMNNVIVPRFKRGDFTGGITAGVESLDRMARGGTSSATSTTTQSSPASPVGGGGIGSLIGCGGIGTLFLVGIVIFVISRSLGGVMGGFGGRYNGYRRPGFGSGMLGGMMLGSMLGGGRRSSSSWSSSGLGGGGFRGGFGGGSFGGGFSGGRGASGSW